jgi:hypothetical protein
MAFSDLSMVNMRAMDITKSAATPTAVRRAALRANCSMYTVMMVPAISGRRLRRRKTLICTITSSKNGAEDRIATAMAKIGTSASTVV